MHSTKKQFISLLLIIFVLVSTMYFDDVIADNENTLVSSICEQFTSHADYCTGDMLGIKSHESMHSISALCSAQKKDGRLSICSFLCSVTFMIFLKIIVLYELSCLFSKSYKQKFILCYIHDSDGKK